MKLRVLITDVKQLLLHDFPLNVRVWTPLCRCGHHCVDRPENTVEHMVEVCRAWAESSVRRSVAATSCARHWSRPWCPGSAEAWEADTSFCEVVMLAKELALREREWHPTSVSKPCQRPSSSERQRGRLRCRPRRLRDDLQSS